MVGYLEEREGHKSSRRLILLIACLNATTLVLAGVTLMSLGKPELADALLASGGLLWGALLPIMNWSKALERGDPK
jgi:hypothetical protein